MFWRILRSTSLTKCREIQIELWIANNKTKMILSSHKNDRNHRIHLPESESSSINFTSVVPNCSSLLLLLKYRHL